MHDDELLNRKGNIRYTRYCVWKELEYEKETSCRDEVTRR